MSNKIFHLQAWFSGHVQGVFFRATAENIASNFKVAGTIKNLPDGCVWLNVEGEKAEVESFLDAVQKAMAPNIQETAIQTEYSEPTMRGFSMIR